MIILRQIVFWHLICLRLKFYFVADDLLKLTQKGCCKHVYTLSDSGIVKTDLGAMLVSTNRVDSRTTQKNGRARERGQEESSG